MRTGEQGLTLIEVLVATFLIGMALVPLLHLYPGTLESDVASETETILSAAAVRKMEELMGIVRAAGAVVIVDSTTGAVQPSATSSSATLTISPAANYVLIIVGLERDTPATVSSVTVGGVAATRIAFGNQTHPESEIRGELWGILNPPTGSQTVTVTLSGSREHSWVAASFTNVSSTTPLGGSATNAARSSTPNASLASRTANSLLVGAYTFDDEFLTTTDGTCQTPIRESEQQNASTQMSRETSLCSAGNDMNWTVHETDTWVAIIVELISAGGSVGNPSGTEACPDLPNCLLVWSTTTELSSATAGVGRLDQVNVVACQDTNASNTCDAGERQVRYDAKVTSRP